MGMTNQAPGAQNGAGKLSLQDLRQMGGQTAVAVGGSNVEAFFQANKAALTAVLPKHLTADRVLRLALSAMRNTPLLREATLASLFGALVTCSKLGLEPDNGLGHVYLIPFKVSKKQKNGQFAKEIEVQVVVGYQGYLELARRSGKVAKVWTRVVYENDHYVLKQGTSESIEHVPARGDRGEMTDVYACAQLIGVINQEGEAEVQFEPMTRAEVERIRDGSQGYQQACAAAEKYNKPNKSPWHTHFDPMARKTAVRQLQKYLPKSVEFAAAIALDDKSGRVSQGLDRVLDGADLDVVVEEVEEEADDAPAAAAQQEQQAPPQPARLTQEAAGPTLDTVVPAERSAAEIENAPDSLLQGLAGEDADGGGQPRARNGRQR